MEYQKIINLLDNTPNQPTKFRIKNWVEINDDACGRYSTNSQTKFKTSMLKSSVWDYRDAYILKSGTITAAELAAGRGNKNIQAVFKNGPPFTDYLSEINNKQIDNSKDIITVIPQYNLIKYNNDISKTSGRLWQYYRDEPTLTDAGTLDNFPGNSASF